MAILQIMERAIVALALVVSSCSRTGFDARSGDSWWEAAWSYRKTLLIAHGAVDEDLADFPLLVALTDPDLAAGAQPDGDDILFTDGAGARLAHEIEEFDATSGRLTAWVKVPSILANSDTTLYLYYGNPSATDQRRAAEVWTNHFTGVYHFGDGITLDLADATGVNHGTNNGAGAATGVVRGAAAFFGNEFIQTGTVGTNKSAGQLNTVSFWLNYTGAPGDAVFVFGDDLASEFCDLWMTDCFGFNTGIGEVLGIASTGLTDRWIHVAAVFYNGPSTPTQNRLYIDGVAQSIFWCSGSASANFTAPGSIAGWSSTGGYEFEGMLDEGRIANVVRSDAWIAAAYRNQLSPATFVAAGAQQSQ